MKKLLNWQILLSLLLITLAFGFYALDYFLFGQLKDIIFYSLIDIAFLFLSGLIVMLFLHRLLEYRGKAVPFQKAEYGDRRFLQRGRDRTPQAMFRL